MTGRGPTVGATAGRTATRLTKFGHAAVREERLRAAAEKNPAPCIWTHPDVAGRLGGLGRWRVHAVTHGDAFTAAGLDVVEVHGE
ncbi:hypothetical protein [Streptomyces sp. cg40]|uniref:hypothetical protein n=1 Tax=Streptomyces sp. cg40 TaxID=3419764 RepID=UPI003D040DD2